MGTTWPQTPRLVQHLRALTPTWSISRREARWVAEQQAKLLLSEAGITGPPVPIRIVTELEGVDVYRLADMPVKGLLSASKPSNRGGDILIDSTLPVAERRVTLLHELKHVIDGAKNDGCDGLCADFAMSVLVPTEWLHSDWHTGQHDPTALAERYQVPQETIQDRLHSFGLITTTPRCHRRRVRCQWHPHPKNRTKLRRRPR